MKKNILRNLFLGLALAMTMFVGNASAGWVVFSGRVMNSVTGNGIPSASVELYACFGRPICTWGTTTVLTSSLGYFTMPEAYTFSGVVTVEKKWYESYSAVVPNLDNEYREIYLTPIL